MDDIQIIERTDGRGYDLVRVERHVIATVQCHIHATLFVDALTAKLPSTEHVEAVIHTPALRGKYPAHQKVRPDNRGADVDREDCRLCGTEFVATAESDGLCARCRRG